jgi:hypothetical protein
VTDAEQKIWQDHPLAIDLSSVYGPLEDRTKVDGWLRERVAQDGDAVVGQLVNPNDCPLVRFVEATVEGARVQVFNSYYLVGNVHYWLPAWARAYVRRLDEGGKRAITARAALDALEGLPKP